MSELVYHPSHYNVVGRKECWDEFVDDYGAEFTIVWCLMTARKYLYRQGLKSGEPDIRDIAKARNYLNKAEDIAINNFINLQALDTSNNLWKLYNDTVADLFGGID